MWLKALWRRRQERRGGEGSWGKGTYSRWDPTQTTKENGEIDFTPDVGFGSAVDEPDCDRGDGADEEGPDERAI